MLVAADRGEVTHIIAYSMSRLTRRPAEWERLIELAQRRGIQFIYSVSPRYDLNTADGRATARTVAAWDAAEAERTSERRALGNSAKLAKGLPLGRPRVFGFEPDGMTPRETEAELLRAAYAHVLDGGTLRSIAAEWNAAGHFTQRGNNWTVTAVRNALLRERNAGILVSRGEVVEGSQITPLVDRDTWEAVRAIITDRKRAPKGRPTGDRFLSRVAVCACGSPMMVGSSWSHGKYTPAYRCEQITIAEREGRSREGKHAQIVAAGVEEAATREVLAVLVGEALAGEVEALPEASDVVRLRARLTALEDERGAAQELYLLPGVDRARVARRIAELGAEHDATRADLDAALSRRSAADVVSAIVEAVRDIVTDVPADDEERGAALRREWDSLPTETRGEIVRAKLDVVIQPGRSAERIQITKRD